MGMAVDQLCAAGLLKHLYAALLVEIDKDWVAGLACLAGIAHLPGQCLALFDRQCQEFSLPWLAAYLAAKGLIGQISQALRVAMAEQPAITKGEQAGGIGQPLYLTVVEEVAADQEITVARHEEDCGMPAGIAQDRQAFGFEGLGSGIVANPDFENVAQQENGLGRCVKQVATQSCQGGRRLRRQMQVGQEVDLQPMRRRQQFSRCCRSEIS